MRIDAKEIRLGAASPEACDTHLLNNAIDFGKQGASAVTDTGINATGLKACTSQKSNNKTVV